MEDSGQGVAALAPAPLFTVFGLEHGGAAYWTVVFLLAFVIVGLVVLNQLLNDTLVLKE